MAMDTPAMIAILGAGPMGIETGLYARYLGYDVVVYERDEIAANVLRWGHLRMFSPFRQLCSPLGLAAIRAQEPDYRPPQVDAQITGRQWTDNYLYPLSRTDLLADHIVCGARVEGVARRHCLKTQWDVDHRRGEDGFRILLEHDDGSQSIETADIVIDTTGVYGQPNWCGAGGIPARGEERLRSRIEYKVPDILGTERARYEARHVLVIGSGLSAATTVVSLNKIVDRVPQTRVTWVTHAARDDDQADPIPLDQFDHLPQRRLLAETANQCAHAQDPRLVHRLGVSVDAFDFDAAEEKFLVWLDDQPDPQSFDRIVANVGYRGDATLYEELQVRTHTRTGGPWGIGEHLSAGADAVKQESLDQRAKRVLTTEPHFYILGAKSYGRDSSYLMTTGYEQIRDLFSIIGDRAELDLYSTMAADI